MWNRKDSSSQKPRSILNWWATLNDAHDSHLPSAGILTKRQNVAERDSGKGDLDEGRSSKTVRVKGRRKRRIGSMVIPSDTQIGVMDQDIGVPVSESPSPQCHSDSELPSSTQRGSSHDTPMPSTAAPQPVSPPSTHSGREKPSDTPAKRTCRPFTPVGPSRCDHCHNGDESDDTRDFKNPASLPVNAKREAILNAVANHSVTLIIGETGCGKTTQIPQILLDGLDTSLNRKSKASPSAHDARSLSTTSPLSIVVTQPRRVAAMSLAHRVASERGCEIGGEVGYQIRFADKTSASTRIRFVTDGILIRTALLDPEMNRYKIIILDEAHERSIRTDILLGLLYPLCSRRLDIRVVIMSATLDYRTFTHFFATHNINSDTFPLLPIMTPNKILRTPIIQIKGRQHHVDLYHVDGPVLDVVEGAFMTIAQIHLTAAAGDILVFLSGQEAIEGLSAKCREMQEKIRENIKIVRAIGMTKDRRPTVTAHYGRQRILMDPGIYGGDKPPDARLKSTSPPLLDMNVIPLYASLPFDQQKLVFKPSPVGTRKIVLATNIAETSLTIPNIRYVIDSGKVKVKSFNPSNGVEVLQEVPVSQAMAAQRAGRAGREAPGEAYRLYTIEDLYVLDEHNEPEITRCDLTQVVLELISIGVENVRKFPWVTPPHPSAIDKAMKTLVMLGALDKTTNTLTGRGTQICKLPLSPMMSNLVITSMDMSCLAEVLSIVSMLMAEAFLTTVKESTSTSKEKANDRRKVKMTALARKRVVSEDGDHLTLLNIYNLWNSSCTQSDLCTLLGVDHKKLQLASNIRQQLKDVLMNHLNVRSIISASHDSPKEASEVIRRCLCKALFLNVAKLDKDGLRYVTEVSQAR
eukprot:GHVN01067371.1.p1 GENE.GHVN01067371.1~~GHVN01067371.1.p1  ORF type:complete len:863 (+),score=127.44 GHVN01067371.1:923-3511(+)